MTLHFLSLQIYYFFLLELTFSIFFKKIRLFNPFLTKITLQNHPRRVFCFHFSALSLTTREGGMPYILALTEITDVQGHGSRIKLALDLQGINISEKIPFL